MELQIPQSFKVQWLNTTLKFIKDDTQLIKDYPQMPSSHVEYLHNLIWQRKNNIGLGFKSLYSPVWEAMKIYSVKYQFKIFVEKSEDGMSGHLIMEKVPKTGQPIKKLNDEKKERDNETIQHFEDTKKLQTEAVEYKQPEPKPLKKAKTKKKPMSKSSKIFMENQNILESLSPLFIKKMLKSILDFLTDKLSASKIFSDLAPIESRFLENFLSIYERKDDFEVMLSPACIEIFTEISNCFDEFSETYCLDISCVGVNSKTNKREVKYTKVPAFLSKKTTKQKLKENSIETKTTTIPSNINTLKLEHNSSVSKEECNMTEVLPKKSINYTNAGTSSTADIASIGVEENTSKTKILQDMTVPSNSDKAARLKENSIQPKTTTIPPKNHSIKIENNSFISKEEYNMTLENLSKETKPSKPKNKTMLDKGISENVCANGERKITKTIDNNVIVALSTSVKKGEEAKPKIISYLKDTSKTSILLPKKSINFTKEGTSNTDTPYVKVEQKSPKMKILRDMTVPLNSDKAERMMQLMGWNGGALGLRGDGITEPIIPIINFKNCGLGHVKVKKESKKEAKKESKKETKTGTNGRKSHNRSEFINNIINMIDNNIEVTVIKLQKKIDERENRFWKLTIQLINDRKNLDGQFERRLEVIDKMIKNKDITFNIDFDDENRKVKITKTSRTEMRVNQNTSKATKSGEIDANTNSEATFKTIVLQAILELIKSEEKEKVIQYNKELKTKHIECTNKIILLINERQHVTHKSSRVVAELGSKVLEAIGDILLLVAINQNERYIVIRKKHPKSNDQKFIKTIVNNPESDENNKNAFDNVRSYLPIKKKHQLLNALYKYEMEITEEFKENQWYNTVDNSLLESQIICSKNTKMMRILQTQ